MIFLFSLLFSFSQAYAGSYNICTDSGVTKEPFAICDKIIDGDIDETKWPITEFKLTISRVKDSQKHGTYFCFNGRVRDADGGGAGWEDSPNPPSSDSPYKVIETDKEIRMTQSCSLRPDKKDFGVTFDKGSLQIRFRSCADRRFYGALIQCKK